MEKFVTCVDEIYHTETPGVTPKVKRMVFVCPLPEHVSAVLGNIKAMKSFSNVRVTDKRIDVDRFSTHLEVVTPEDERFYYEKDFIKLNKERVV